MMNNIIITVDLEYDWESEKIDNILVPPRSGDKTSHSSMFV